MDIKKILSNIFLFNTFSDKEIDKIVSFSNLLQLKSRSALFEEGATAEFFYVVVSGKVKVYKLSLQGSEQILHIHKPFDLVAEASIFDQGKYPADCEAVTESTVLKISGEKFVNLIIENPKISLKLLKSYSQRLRGFVSMIRDLSLSDVRGRLASYMMRNSREVNGKLICELKISKKELSSVLGTIPETLSRNIKSLKEDGLLAEDGKSFELLDISRLKEYLV